MDFGLTEEQLLLKRTVREFAAKELEPLAGRLDEEEEFPTESVRKMAQLGLTGLTIPLEYGGSGGDYLQLVIAIEELARACASTSIILGASLSLGCQSIYRFGTEEQKQRFVVPLARGEKLAAFALSEPNVGSDAAAVETTAVHGDDFYILNGTKNFITNGDVADIVVIVATVDRSMGHRGLTTFIVEKGTPGFSSITQSRKLGLRASKTAQLLLEDCRVPGSNRLGEEGMGFKQALQILDGSRIVVAAQAVGIAQAALEASLRYAKQRHQFGKPIAEFQAIQWMLADMATGISAAQLLTYRAADLKEKGLPHTKEASMAKVFASEVAMSATTKAMQIHGGYSYFKDYPVERYFRDSKITEIYEGTSEMQRLVIARSLLAEVPL